MIAIVGAGAAGVAAAVALRELGADDEVRVFGAEGVVPYERPVLSKGALTDPFAAQPPPLVPGGLARRGLAVELDGEVLAIDAAARELHLASGWAVEYDRLLLATGAEPRRFSAPGAELRGIFTLRDLADAHRLRPALHAAGRVVVIGGGVIGLEVAASARAVGCAVTVVEVAPQVMGRIVPGELAGAIADLHRGWGVDVRVATRPVGFEGDASGRVRSVVLDDGELLDADVVVVGIGVVPRVDLAIGAGLAVDDGVVVDEHFRTSDEHVFAAGDVARVHHAGEGRHVRIEQWEAAQDQGRRAAANMAGAAEPYRAVPWMWSDQGEAHIQMAGFGFSVADQVVRRGSVEDPGGLSFLAVRGDRLVAACGVSLGMGVARTVRPAQRLIEGEVPVDPERLRDPGVDLRRLARQHAGAR